MLAFCEVSTLSVKLQNFLKKTSNSWISQSYELRYLSPSTEWNFCSLIPEHGMGLHCRCLCDIRCGKYVALGMLRLKEKSNCGLSGEWTLLLPYQNHPSFPSSSSNRPLFRFFRFFSATHSNILVSFTYIVDYSPVLTLLRIQNTATHASTGRHCMVATSLERHHLYPGLVFISLRFCVYNLNRAKMFCFYLMNLGLCPCLNYLDCLRGGLQMYWMLQSDSFVLAL